MRWYQYSIADFEATTNPPNGGFVVMERKENSNPSIRRTEGPWFELTNESLDLLNLKKQQQWGSLWKLFSELPGEPEEEAGLSKTWKAWDDKVSTTTIEDWEIS